MHFSFFPFYTSLVTRESSLLTSRVPVIHFHGGQLTDLSTIAYRLYQNGQPDLQWGTSHPETPSVLPVPSSAFCPLSLFPTYPSPLHYG
jgi:hypothetical protein